VLHWAKNRLFHRKFEIFPLWQGVFFGRKGVESVMNIGKHFTAQNGVEQREQEIGNGEGAGNYSVHVGLGGD
jgi:hypothetical protein